MLKSAFPHLCFGLVVRFAASVFILLTTVGSSAVWAQKPDTPGDKPKYDVRYQDNTNPDAEKAYQERIRKETLNGVYIPKDLKDCFAQLDKLMDEDAKATFMAFSDEEVDSKTHLSMGKWLEYKWELREGSRISAYLRNMGLNHPDYMISLLIVSYHRHLHGRDLKLKEQVDFFKSHWEKQKATKEAEMLKNAGITPE